MNENCVVRDVVSECKVSKTTHMYGSPVKSSRYFETSSVPSNIFFISNQRETDIYVIFNTLTSIFNLILQKNILKTEISFCR